MSDEDVNTVYTPGAGVGGKLAKLVADATVATRQKLTPHTVKVASQVFTDVTNHVSDEVRSVMGPIFRAIAEHPDTPDYIKPLAQQLATGRGQAWAWIGGTAAGAAMGGGLLNLLTNEMNPAVLPLIAANPHNILDPSTAAGAFQRGHISEDFSRGDAAKGGMNGDRWKALRDLQTSYPAPAEVVEMLNRELISADVARELLHHNGFNEREANLVLGLRHYLPTLADLSAMINRDIIGDDTGELLARRNGATKEDWERWKELGGEPLGVMELSEAYRRGFIDKARFNRGVVQGPIRKEWFDVLEKLQFRRMSVVDAADAVNQGHMSEAEGKSVAHDSGLEPKDFETLLKTAGMPPGLEFAIDALNRGEITEAQFRTMFLESRIKNIYLPLMLKMRTRLIPQETARLLYRNGVYTEAQTLKTLMAHGFTLDDAKSLMALERTRTDDTTRELTRSQIVDMYEERMITADDCVSMLRDLGYTEDDSRAMVELANLSRIKKFINSAISKVKSAYVSNRIDEITASAALDQLGIPVEQRDDLYPLWDIKKSTITKELTAAQIRQAVKKNLITQDDALSRLIGQGYDPDDADIYLQLSA